MTYSTELLKAAHKHCSNNRGPIQGSATCGCFYCCRTYPAGEVHEYVSPDDALCPKCGIDSVLADASGHALTEEFLRAMYEYWFNTDAEATD